MKINYDKLFNPDEIKIEKDISYIDSIIEYEEVLFAISESIIKYRKEGIQNRNLKSRESSSIRVGFFV